MNIETNITHSDNSSRLLLCIDIVVCVYNSYYMLEFFCPALTRITIPVEMFWLFHDTNIYLVLLDVEASYELITVALFLFQKGQMNFKISKSKTYRH